VRPNHGPAEATAGASIGQAGTSDRV
jgi:hypothetical protein